MGGWDAGRMEGWESVRQEKTKEEEGSSREEWREGEDKALYHDSLERVCLRQTPSRSPSPGRRYVKLNWPHLLLFHSQNDTREHFMDPEAQTQLKKFLDSTKFYLFPKSQACGRVVLTLSFLT